MNRAPISGDIITIKRKDVIVVATAGVWPCNITTIKRDDLGKVNPKTTDYLISLEASEGTTALRDVMFHEQIKLKAKVDTTYIGK